MFAECPDEYAQLDRRIDYYIETTGLGQYNYVRGTAAQLGMALPSAEVMDEPPPLLPDPDRQYQDDMIQRRNDWLGRQPYPSE